MSAKIRQYLVILHRWIGLASTLVLMAAGATGSMIVVMDPGRVRSLVGRLHESLALGRRGTWIVVTVTAAAVVIEVTGLVLWWRTRVFWLRTRSGWQRFVTDLHYSTGAVGFVLMIVIAVTGALLPFVGPKEYPTLRRLLMEYHTGFNFHWSVKVLYFVASLAFVVQGITGVVMWWTRGRAKGESWLTLPRRRA